MNTSKFIVYRLRCEPKFNQLRMRQASLPQSHDHNTRPRAHPKQDCNFCVWKCAPRGWCRSMPWVRFPAVLIAGVMSAPVKIFGCRLMTDDAAHSEGRRTKTFTRSARSHQADRATLPLLDPAGARL